MTAPGFQPPDWRAREAALLAPWAMHAADTAGRVHPEQLHPFRSPYQRDRDRIVHSAAFRRLAHKTQVFTGYHGDYHRSRLTHTLEVTNIARTLARALALNEDLVETLALAHDIGHPPLGHAGEDTLAELLRDEGGFNHNAQALRIMELLETRYPQFPGLNLSREVLDAQATRKKDGTAPAPLLETQVVDAADSIAYDTHDADDAIELGLVSLDELLELPLVAAAASRVRDRLGPLGGSDLRRAVIHELVDYQVAELIRTSLGRLRGLGIRSVDDVRAAGVVPSDESSPIPTRWWPPSVTSNAFCSPGSTAANACSPFACPRSDGWKRSSAGTSTIPIGSHPGSGNGPDSSAWPGARPITSPA